MIENAHGLFVSLHQLSGFADMLEVLRRDAECRNDDGEFAHLSQSYLVRIRELNAEIRDFLRSPPEAAPAGSATDAPSAALQVGFEANTSLSQ